MQTELTWQGVSTQLQHRVPPFPQLTNSRLQTTAVGRPAPYEPHGTVIVSTDERACCLECCHSDDPRACSEKRAIIRTTDRSVKIVIFDNLSIHHRRSISSAEELTHLDCAWRLARALLSLDFYVVHLAAHTLDGHVIDPGNRAACCCSVRARSRLLF